MPAFDQPLNRFFALAFGWSWSVAAVLAATGGIGSQTRHLVGGFVYMLGPALAAIVVTRRQSWAERKVALGLRFAINPWLAAAWGMPVLALTLATFGSALVPGVHLVAPAAALVAKVTAGAGPEQAAKLAAVPAAALTAGLIFQALILGPVINLPFMLSEELGWRGYLWSRWSALGFWPQALATGVVWGLWHAPLILMGHNYPDAPVLGVGLMIVFCTLLSPLLHLVRARGGTLWHACLFHGTVNAGATLGDLCIQSDSWVGRGIVGLPGFAALAVLVALSAFAMRRGPTPPSR